MQLIRIINPNGATVPVEAVPARDGRDPMKPNYSEAKAIQVERERNMQLAEAALAKYPRSASGLVSDSIREMPGWKEAKRASVKAFSELREINACIVRNYSVEEKLARNERRAARERIAAV